VSEEPPVTGFEPPPPWSRTRFQGLLKSVEAQCSHRIFVDFYRSDDGGVNWVNKPGAHVDHHKLAAERRTSKLEPVLMEHRGVYGKVGPAAKAPDRPTPYPPIEQLDLREWRHRSGRV